MPVQLAHQRRLVLGVALRMCCAAAADKFGSDSFGSTLRGFKWSHADDSQGRDRVLKVGGLAARQNHDDGHGGQEEEEEEDDDDDDDDLLPQNTRKIQARDARPLTINDTN